ncbi:MazG nucleotide pyrophosphohydrolase domain-containing protein [Clostridium sp. Ade.TY]|uniref:MazG nucleotide pyrophosphohydrolase domain-containing protein n=1 Tax=Clostridium sp. Ade.TY TaxID=1391647 RepID=UPI0003FFD2D1|nr:MazG nucleotide pyrophosphohydrolase domain-containing protein [Clostridium sp. Ade.TY]
MNNIKKIVNHYGEEAQAHKAIEELNELAVAIAHQDKEAMLEEIADVYIMMEQLKEFDFFDYDKFSDMVVYKLQRQIKRIEEES